MTMEKKMTDALREKLVNAGRVLALEGQGDYVAGHVSVRLPDDPGHFLMKPAGIGLEEMTAGNIITVDIEGRRVAGSMPRHNEVFIHSEVLRARPDVNAVVHTHPIHAVAFSSLGKPLVAVGNDASLFATGLPVFDETTDLIIDQSRGKAVARCLADRPALILRNHGIVTAAASIEEAIWVALKLEKACHTQLLAEAAGGPKLVVKEDDLGKKASRSNRPDLHNNVFNYLVRRWRCVCCGERVQAPQVAAYESWREKGG
jgi:L-ribulose-5-phosphate 4-epimerase